MRGSGVDLVRLVRELVEAEAGGALRTLRDGVVDDVAGDRASVRFGGSQSPALPGFAVPPHLTVLAGDHVQVFWQGGYQLILSVLNRNALNAALEGGDSGTSTSGSPNLDGGTASSVYGGGTVIDGGTA